MLRYKKKEKKKFKDLNFKFSEISPEIILNILKGLNPSKAAGIDNLSVITYPIDNLYF